MRISPLSIVALVFVAVGCANSSGNAGQNAGVTATSRDAFEPLFNGKDLTGWRIPEGDGGHWRVVDGVIDYDARSEARGDKSLWTEGDFGDYVLRIDWRIKDVSHFTNLNVPIILADGSLKLNEKGEVIRMAVPNADSGIMPRGHAKGQANIWNWPVGSGEVYGYRNDESMPAEVRRAAVPLVNADKNIGEWNTFEITMRGDRMTVVLNDQLVIDRIQLTEVPGRGPIGLQHHGGMQNGEWASPPSLVQFRNILIRRLN